MLFYIFMVDYLPHDVILILSFTIRGENEAIRNETFTGVERGPFPPAYDHPGGAAGRKDMADAGIWAYRF